MPSRDIVHVQTLDIAPGALPLSARRFQFVACLRIVTERDRPLQFYGQVTGVFYNERGRPVWSRRVNLYKLAPRNDDNDAASVASTASQQIVDYSPEDYTRFFPHRHQDRTPVAQYHHHRPLPYHLHRQHPHYQPHPHHHPRVHFAPHPHQQTYLTRNRTVHVFNSSPVNSPNLVQIQNPSNTGHWYTAFDRHQRRWVDHWRPN